MIGKAALAAVALTCSLGVIAPIALASGGSGNDACGLPPGQPTPTIQAPTIAGRIAATPAAPGIATPHATVDSGKAAALSGVVSAGAETDQGATADCAKPVGPNGALPGADQAVARAMRLVGSHGYYQLCARLAANIWGRPRAGYFSAAEQWRQMVATNNAHPGDRRPPSGALVFWETGGPYGHVAVYLGEGRIVSNDINDDVPGEGGVYLVDFGLIESKWGATYLGWAPPIYSTT